MAGLTARALSKLALPGDAEALLSLPPPERSSVAAARPAAVRAVAQAFGQSWGALFSDHPPSFPLPTALVCPSCGATHDLDEVASWNRLLLITGAYYDFAVGRLLGEATQGKDMTVPWASIPMAERVLDRIRREDLPAFFISGGVLTAHYITCLAATHVIWLPTHHGFCHRMAPVRDAVVLIEAVAHNALASLVSDTEESATRDQRALAGRGARTLAKHLAYCYRGVADARPQGHEYGPFSDLRPAELPHLAERHPSAVAHYGAKGVERALEQQLAMIFQSLGFYVVPARRGERTVDLVCISGDQANSFTFLLEAKSSHTPYTLPVSDERALTEYIRELPKTVPSINPARFALLVGGTAGRTLGPRLSRVEAATGVPVRFLAAREIARLRELAPSLLPMSIFCDHVLEGPAVLPDGFGRMLAGKYGAAQAAHSAFARTMLSLRPQTHVKPDDALVWCRQAPPESPEGAK